MTDRRDAIAAELEKGLAETVSLFKSLSPENLRMKLYQDGAQWTMQQVLAHFAAIERSMHRLFEDILAGGPGAPPDFDFERYNLSQTRKYDGLTLDELIDRFKEVRQETVRIVREMKEEDLDREGLHAFHGQGRLDRFIRWAYEHARIHEGDIRKVLEKTAEPVAHVTENGSTHSLREHLFGTAERAAEFAGGFGFHQWGRLAGLWHDLGKYSPAFQKKIRAAMDPEAHLEAKARVDHSTAGGLKAIQEFGLAGRILAYIAAGHHAGLPDWVADSTGSAALSQRLLKNELLSAALQGFIPEDILDQVLPAEKPIGFDPAFWVRMLFSCLVDADFLDTEAFFDPQISERRGQYPPLADLLQRFESFMVEKQACASPTPVNRIRSEVLRRCIEMSNSEPGVYSLTVPTGGGKTLSSMAFALHHATTHGQKRIIYVIPYTSIIEQTADQFRQIFGEAVVEHHSNLDVADEVRETPASRLACENWDAPIIVTTSVQFFESLFASRTSRCRKLHNIAGSVVVLDETQLLPPEFLNPILKVMIELRKNYGVTFLLSTATQPALGPQRGPGFVFEGIADIREVMENPAALYQSLKRVEVKVPERIHEPCTWESLTEELAGHSSVLCIVNRRDDCRQLWTLMPEGTIHLSALMCGAHRSKKIGAIRKRLEQGLPTRVISTQLVEAGVDVDFPVVYRALAGLDSIAQAAGRCNREGLLEKGTVVVFIPPSRPPVGVLRQAAEIGGRLLSKPGDDPLALDQFAAFFKELYWLQGDRLDSKRILPDLAPDCGFRFSFRSTANRFHLIDESQQAPVVTIYGEEGAKLVDQLIRRGPERWLLRRLQRYVVNLPQYLHRRLLAEGTIREIHAGICVQGHGALYDDNLGFCPDKSIIYEPDELIM
jgi:CRISPR-associated endonuclease/helicase Cas3